MILDRIINRQQHKETADSSAISAVEYDPRRQSMIVNFKNGRRYQYGCVDRDTYRQMTTAPSIGKFFHQRIRNQYPYRQIDG